MYSFGLDSAMLHTGCLWLSPSVEKRNFLSNGANITFISGYATNIYNCV